MPTKFNYYHKAFNIVILLLKISLLSYLIKMILKQITIQSIDNLFFLGNTKLFDYIRPLIESEGIFNRIQSVTISLIIISLIIEILLRVFKDSPKNLIISIYKTIAIRWFIYKVSNDSLDRNKFTLYNNTVSHCTVNVHNQSIKVTLRLPANVDSVKLYKQADPIIFEEIVNSNPNFYFSSPMRIGKWIQIIGSKR